jgi:hypothetical protein
MRVEIDIPFLSELPEVEMAYVQAVFNAHQTAARINNNVSSQVARGATFASGSFRQGVMAAIGTIGGVHAPIRAAKIALLTIKPETQLPPGARIPGWGNSFFKGVIDPAWKEADALLPNGFREVLDMITKKIGKPVVPNAAAYSAIACIVAGVPDQFEDLFFMLPRIPVWAEICLKG